MSDEPIQIYTPTSFLEAEYKRIAGSWFWKTYRRHLETQLTTHMDLAMASASGAAENLRVAAAMASAYRTALALPDLMRTGQVKLAGQVIGQAPPRGAVLTTDDGDEEDASPE